MYNRSLIIPSAGLSTRLYPLSYNTPKVLIKLNGVPIFHLLYKKAKEVKVDNIIISVAPEFERQVQEFVNEVYANSDIPIYVQVVDKPEEGVLYSIYQATKHEKAKAHLLVILSDTLYTAELPVEEPKSFVVVEKVNRPLNRWCLANIGPEWTVKSFSDKPQDDDRPYADALIGIYYVEKIPFNHAAQQILCHENKLRGEYQISQALELYIHLGHPIYGVYAKEGAWHDTGTLLTLQQASGDYFLAREFNNISIKNGFLYKTSTNVTALRNQYVWYTQNPHISPQIYEYVEKGTEAELKMELCTMNDLGTIFNFCKAEPVFFKQTIDFLLNEMQTRLWSLTFPGHTCGCKPNKEMFLKKVVSRIEEVSWINSEKFYDLFSALRDLAHTKRYARIHGDFILSNILFEPQRMNFKLIDPRGNYGGLGVYGDIRYDLAKLLHSVDGCYETIIHNLYEIKDEKVIFFMSNEKRKCFDVACDSIFDFASQQGINPDELRLIEASLFLSMIPLHADDKKRQRAFYLTALRILGDNV